MARKALNKTKIALWILLLHVAYASLFASCVIAEMLLVDNRIFGLITAMLAIVIFLLTFMFPIINIGSIIFQVWALRRGESKWKNILMMMITVVCAAVIFALGVRFWQGAMSV